MNRSIAVLFIVLSVFVAQAASRPNIIFILADDMGFGDVQALNPKSKIPTPNLNRLAAEGMAFTDAHSPSAVCTPTRYGVVTGRYCWRSKLKSGVLNGYGTPLIEKTRATVASHLKSGGYHTAVIGKWHLGLGFQKDAKGDWDWNKPLDHTPVDLGFERSLVIPASLDFPPYVFVDGHTITGKPNRVQEAQGFPAYLRKGELGSDFSIIDCLDQLTTASVEHIKESAKKDKPFFLYFPLTSPHKPVFPHPRFKGKTELGPYGDFVMQTDWVVGQVMEAVEAAGISNSTLIMFTSDNGSFMYRNADKDEPNHLSDETEQRFYEGDHTANGPYRGTKADVWEAGHRVPFFAKWPGVIKAGSKSAKTICHVDLFATASDVAGMKLPHPSDAAPDSFSLVPLFKGNEKAFKRAPVINHSSGGMFAIRNGDWKLVLGNGSGGRQLPKGKRFTPPWQLFHLGDDIGETKDLVHSEQELVADMESALFKILADDRSRPASRRR
ncbi:arylsulfatase [bacterium]|nr:arylsulfatase [bacterium]